MTLYYIHKKSTTSFDTNNKEQNQQILRMKLSRYTNHIALQTHQEIILLDYSKDDKVGIIQ